MMRAAPKRSWRKAIWWALLCAGLTPLTLMTGCDAFQLTVLNGCAQFVAVEGGCTLFQTSDGTRLVLVGTTLPPPNVLVEVRGNFTTTVVTTCRIGSSVVQVTSFRVVGTGCRF